MAFGATVCRKCATRMPKAPNTKRPLKMEKHYDAFCIIILLHVLHSCKSVFKVTVKASVHINIYFIRAKCLAIEYSDISTFMVMYFITF